MALVFMFFFFFKQKTAYEMRISDWSSDVCSSDLLPDAADGGTPADEHRRYPRPFLGCRAARLSVDRGGIAVRSQLPPRGLSARLGRGAGETDGVRRMR